MTDNANDTDSQGSRSSVLQSLLRDVFVVGLVLLSTALAVILFFQSSISNLISKNFSGFTVFAQGNGANESCRPISSLPLKIKIPGTYCLTRDLVNSNPKRNSIVIMTDGVTLDGQNFCISGSTNGDATHSGIRAIDHKQLVIKNICINGHKTGIIVSESKTSYQTNPKTFGTDSFSLNQNIQIINSSLSRQTFQGIHIRGSNILVSNNSIQHTGGYSKLENAFATGIYTVATNCKIEKNRIFDLRPSGNGEAVGIALYLAAGCTISQNHIDPFRTTPYGRRYGVWVRPFLENHPFVISNTVVNVEYAFGPLGFYKDNISLNVSCSLFVDRTFSFPPNRIQGWLTHDNNTMLSTPKTPKCKDNPEYAIERATKNLNPFSAYAVACALAEQDPATHSIQQISWYLLAAELGHETARNYMERSATLGHPKATFAQAQAEFISLKKKLKLAESKPAQPAQEPAKAN